MTDLTGAGTSKPSGRDRPQPWQTLTHHRIRRRPLLLTIVLITLMLTAVFSKRARSAFPHGSTLAGAVQQGATSLLNYSWPQRRRATVLTVANPHSDYRLPGEFEPQQGLLLSGDLAEGYEALFLQIVNAAHRNIRIVVWVHHDAQQQLVSTMLREASVSPETVSIVCRPHDSKWLRDFAPLVLLSRRSAAPICLDMTYLGAAEHHASNQKLAECLGFETRHSPIHLDGGNLLSNGEGLGLTTAAVLEANPRLGKKQLAERFSAAFGLDRLVILEPLQGEPTGHVDMFTTFTAADVVVVGSYDQTLDATNAAILDRNAERLASIGTLHGPLRVVRIPMPARVHGNWRTYTNVVYANGTILMPSYGEETQQERQAVATYARLLPDWRLVRIRANRLIAGGGALHCIAMNLASTGTLSSDSDHAATHAVAGRNF